MIDANDKQTQPLALDEQTTKAKRGRPATGQALSNAERQRAYRERQKAQRNEKPEIGLRGALNNWEEACRNLGRATGKIQELEAQIRELEAQLAKRNEKKRRHRDEPAAELPDEEDDKTWTLQGRTGTGKWQNLAAGLDRTEASRQLDRVIDAKISGESKRQYRLVQD